MAFEDGFGAEVTARHDDGVTVELPIHAGLLNTPGILHGGMIATLADETAWHALQHQYGKRAEQTTTTELKVNYLRPIIGSKAVARAVVLKAGRTLCVSRVDIYDDQSRLGAVAMVTYMLL
ncbi:MAG: PaaI family thioesterase [Acidobacteria bacterium]|nr:PaaI family thioesterase [Acidobacteriota bacterium]